MHQRDNLLQFGLYDLKKIPNLLQSCSQLLNDCLTEQFYSLRLQRVVFALLALSGVFTVCAGLSILISQGVETDQPRLGLPWLTWHVRFDSLSGLFSQIAS
ncbi:MAG: hypothetical protein L3J75_02525 [Methylococcaceae bacterium]|nr:hypothetical protein [Methylococcaceae bacterium]